MPAAGVEREAPQGLERRYPIAGDAGALTVLHQYVDLLVLAGTRPRSFLSAAPARRAAAVLLAEMVADLIDEADDELPLLPVKATEAPLVEAAETIMRARLEDQLPMREVAAALGISARRLQYAFQRVRGTTPRAWLGGLRLELAQQRLSDPSETCTVSRIALECGIAHIGRFAAAYAARYGESPSQTLRRARRRPLLQ